MSKADKLLARMAANPKGDWTMADVQTLCAAHGCLFRRGKGSHVSIAHESAAEILTIPAHRPIKPLYIKKLVRFVEGVRGSKNDGP